MSVPTANQQGKITDIEMGWLCGIIDGEGTIALRWSMTRGKRYLVPFVQIANGSVPTLDKVVATLQAIGVGHHIQWKEPQAGGLTKHRYWVLITTGMKRTKRLLFAILPYLVTKRRQGELVLDFIRERESKQPTAPYGEELKILQALRDV